ncbi:hypothetical protein Tco_0516034 [Tanacetum coccineum]
MIASAGEPQTEPRTPAQSTTGQRLVNGDQPPSDHQSMVVKGGGQRRSTVVNDSQPPPDHRSTTAGSSVNGGLPPINDGGQLGQVRTDPGRVTVWAVMEDSTRFGQTRFGQRIPYAKKGNKIKINVKDKD